MSDARDPEATAGELSPIAEAAWQRFERTIEFSASFWLGFLFTSSSRTAGILCGRVARMLKDRGQPLLVLCPEAPAEMLGVLPALLGPAAGEVGYAWVEPVRLDFTGASAELWQQAWDNLVLRMNERREGLRSRLKGGLILVAPPAMRRRIQQSAGDLWSVRRLVIELPIEADASADALEEELGLGPPLGVDADVNWTPDPKLAMDEARRRERVGGEGARIPQAASLLRAVEGFLARKRIEEAVAAAREAVDVLRNAPPDAVFDLAAGLAALAEAERAHGDVASAAQYIEQAIALRHGSEERILLRWLDIKGQLALGKRDIAMALSAYDEAVSLSRKLYAAWGERPETLGDLAASLHRLSLARRRAGDAKGAKAAADEAMSIDRRMRLKPDEQPAKLYLVKPLPPLTEKIDPGPAGAQEFERLMHELLLSYAHREVFPYLPTDDMERGTGVDAVASTGVPGLDGPVAFMFKWTESQDGGLSVPHKPWYVPHAAASAQHLVVVSPLDGPGHFAISDSPSKSEQVNVHHWGKNEIESLLHACPALFARYYPEQARALLDDYTGFDFREFAARYREKVGHVYQSLRTLGIPPDVIHRRDSRMEMRLREIFVPLRLVPEESGAEPKDLVDFLRDRASTVVLGDPGSGKSTLLAFLALLFAGQATLPGSTPPPDAVPLLISLRDFARLQHGKPDLSFLEYLEIRARSDFSLADAHRAFFESALRMGEAVVLLDGLDEVGGELARHRVATAIRTFRAEYPNCPFWVTSRIYGYTRDVELPKSLFRHARAGRLEDAQVDDFISRWYTIQIPQNPRERREHEDSLRAAVHRTPRVQALAGNPLLLTLMAFIHGVLGTLPQDRGELYDKCVEMLLKTWREARRGPGQAIARHPFEELGLLIHTQKEYLAHLAMFVQEQNQSRGGDDARGLIDRKVALECLAARHQERSLRERPNLSLEQARDEMGHFLDYLSDETGLVIDRGGGQLSFIHLSFQEYLAAWVFTCEAAGTTPGFFEKQVDFFDKHLGEPAWEEVLLLRMYIILNTQGGGGEKAFDAIVAPLMRKLEDDDSPSGWLTLARALRDNLGFAARDRKAILEKALDYWQGDPRFAGDWFAVLEEVRLFSDKSRSALAELLAQRQKHGGPAAAIACLHLEEKLFGFPNGAADRLRARADLPELLPDLVAFLDKPDIAGLLAERASLLDWTAAFTSLDSPELYRATLGWATGASPCPVASPLPLQAAHAMVSGKIHAEIQSRAAFAEQHRSSDAARLFDAPGRIRLDAPDSHCAVEVPLAGLHVRSVGGTLPSSGVAWLPATGSQRPVHCVKLCREKFAASLDEGMFNAALAGWAESVLATHLIRFPAAEPIAPDTLHHLAAVFVRSFARALGHAFIRDLVGAFGRDSGVAFGRAFTSDFARAFARNFARGFSRDFAPPSAREFAPPSAREFAPASARDFGRASARDFGRAFARDFGRDFTRAFGREFGRAFGRHFGRDFGRDFASAFGRKFGRTFGRHFGREFGRDFTRAFGVDPGAPDWDGQWDRAMADQKNVNDLLGQEKFWDYCYFFWGGHAEAGIECSVSELIVRVHNPFALPLALTDVWAAAAVNELYSLGRYLAVRFPAGNVSDEAMEEWALQNPINVYGAAFAWEEHAKVFAEKRGRLAGPEGALMMAHAEYATLMTGICFNGPVWTRLLAERDPALDAKPEVPPPPPPAPAVSVPAASVAPVPAARPGLEPQPLFSWIHLSDIHFGHPSTGHRWDQQLVLDALRKDIVEARKDGCPLPDVILVTGDIAFSGDPAQYTDAKEWLDKVAKAARLDLAKVFTVPGNHDVDRAADKDRNTGRLIRGLRSGEEDLDEALSNPGDRALLARRLQSYLAFEKELAPVSFRDCKDPGPHLFWWHCLEARGGLRVRLIGLNTALLCADDIDREKLRIGKAAHTRPFTSPEMDEAGELIVVLSHHPFRDSWLADQRDADAWVRNRAHVHLFGHIHDADIEETRAGSGDSFLRIAAGAAHGEREPPGVPAGHGYSFAAVIPAEDGSLKLRVWPRAWSEKKKAFRVDVENVRSGQPYAEHSLARVRLKKPV